MKRILRLSLYAGAGLYDKVREMVDDLVKRGELLQQEGKDLLTEVSQHEHERGRLKELQEKVETSVGRAIERLPRPATMKDLAAIEERLLALEAKLAEIEAAAAAHR